MVCPPPDWYSDQTWLFSLGPAKGTVFNYPLPSENIELLRLLTCQDVFHLLPLHTPFLLPQTFFFHFVIHLTRLKLFKRLVFISSLFIYSFLENKSQFNIDRGLILFITSFLIFIFVLKSRVHFECKFLECSNLNCRKFAIEY